MRAYMVITVGTIASLLTDEQLNCIQDPMKGPPPDKGAPPWGKDACVLYWAHSANPKEKIVLYDPDAKKTYFVDDEDTILPYVGDHQKVTVTGTYNEATKTIHVTHVQP